MFRGLLALVRGLDPALAEVAARRLAALAGLPHDPAAGPAAWATLYAVWWWRAARPERDLSQALAQLAHDNPSARFRAAQELALLPLPVVRDALSTALGREPLPWVTRALLDALSAVTGEDLRARADLAGEALRAHVQAVRLRLSEMASEGRAGRAPGTPAQDR